VTAVSIRGLESLRRRLEARGLSRAVDDTLRREAEAIAEDAARAAPGRLGQTVEVIDESRGEVSVYAVGTSHPAGRFIEHGTMHRPATPWLFPAFRARLPRVKQRLRHSLAASFARPGSEV
jgi:hypothetical protein